VKWRRKTCERQGTGAEVDITRTVDYRGRGGCVGQVRQGRKACGGRKGWKVMKKGTPSLPGVKSPGGGATPVFTTWRKEEGGRLYRAEGTTSFGGER